jgi:hypothetical protein
MERSQTLAKLLRARFGFNSNAIDAMKKQHPLKIKSIRASHLAL